METYTQTYKVYYHRTGGYRAVKQGFSWSAFFFTWLWAFVKKLWDIGIIGLIVWTVLGPFTDAIIEQNNIGPLCIILLLNLAYVIVFGAFGNRWYMNSLENRDFEYIDTVTAMDTEDAMIQVADRRVC